MHKVSWSTAQSAHCCADKHCLRVRSIHSHAIALLLAASTLFQAGCVTPYKPNKAVNPSSLGHVWLASAPELPEIEIPSMRGNEADFKRNARLLTTAAQETLRDKVNSEALTDGAHLSVLPPSHTKKLRLSAGTLDTEARKKPTGLFDRQDPAESETDTVLEVRITRIILESTDRSSLDPTMTLGMVAHSRLVRTSDNAEIGYTNYSYKGKRLKVSEWSAKQFEELTHELNDGYDSLARDIYDETFRLYPFPSQNAEGTFEAFGLIHTNPVGKVVRTFERRSFVSVDSLQPTFRWKVFPRISDLKIAPGEMNLVRNVRYDIRITPLPMVGDMGDIKGDATASKYAEVAYRRNGLPSNEHTIETPLDSDTPYCWSIRARFELDGRQRVTEWSRVSEFGVSCFITPPKQRRPDYPG